MSIKVKLGTREVDFTEVPPFTGRDKKELKKLDIDFRHMADLDPEKESQFLLYLVKKVDTAATQDEVDNLPLQIQQDIIKHFVQASRSVQSPFSPPSTSSLPSTGGEKTR